MKKAPRSTRGLHDSGNPSSPSAGPHIGCLKTFAPRRRRKLHGLAVLERLEPFSGNLRMMDEEIFSAIVRGDESKTLLLVEPLYHTSCHVVFSLDPPDPYSEFPLLVAQGYAPREESIHLYVGLSYTSLVPMSKEFRTKRPASRPDLSEARAQPGDIRCCFRSAPGGRAIACGRCTDVAWAWGPLPAHESSAGCRCHKCVRGPHAITLPGEGRCLAGGRVFRYNLRGALASAGKRERYGRC